MAAAAVVRARFSGALPRWGRAGILVTKSSHGPQYLPALRAGILPKTEQKARNLPALCAGTLQIYAPGDPPPAFSAPRYITFTTRAHRRAQTHGRHVLSQNAFIPTRRWGRHGVAKFGVKIVGTHATLQ